MRNMPFRFHRLLGPAVALGCLLLGSRVAFSATGEVTLAWNPSPSSLVGGYKIHYGLSSHNYSTTVDVGNKLTHTITNLEPGTKYYYTASAYNVARTEESTFSNEVSGTIPTAAFTANVLSGLAPLYVTFTNQSTGSITQRTWNFGDGGSSTATSPSYSFNTPGVYSVRLTVRGPEGSSTSSAVVINVCCTTAIPPGVNLDFFTVAPCRLVDTREPAGPLQGPALPAKAGRIFTLVGKCGIPATARALSVNLAVTQPTVGGNVRLYPAGTALPGVSSINYSANQTRSNNAIVFLDANGRLAAFANQSSGSVHLILDVNGYFE